MDTHTNDKYIYFAINALDILRTNPEVEDDVKDFTHIVEQMIIGLEKWENLREDAYSCGVILLALEEWSKTGFGGSSGILIEHYKKMLAYLHAWQN